ncbi:MAG: hypothetical protein IKF17_03310 [Clostridia bacterium]|nr:hypothetical protein [Clostridia bacterium]
MNKKKVIVAIVGVIAVIIVLIIVFITLSGKNNKVTNTNEGTDIQQSNNNSSIQQQIDEQEAKIEKINGELTPMIEEKEKLEKQLTDLTGTAVEQSTEEEVQTEEPEETETVQTIEE